MGVDAGAAVGEFMQIQLSQDDRALLAQPRQDRCVANRDVIFQDDGAGRGLHPLRVEEVLDGDGYPVQRPPVVTARDLPLGGAGLSHGRFRQYREVGIEGGIEPLDAVELGPDDLNRRYLLRPNFRGELGDGPVAKLVRWHRPLPSTTRRHYTCTPTARANSSTCSAVLT